MEIVYETKFDTPFDVLISLNNALRVILLIFADMKIC